MAWLSRCRRTNSHERMALPQKSSRNIRSGPSGVLLVVAREKVGIFFRSLDAFLIEDVFVGGASDWLGFFLGHEEARGGLVNRVGLAQREGCDGRVEGSTPSSISIW